MTIPEQSAQEVLEKEILAAARAEAERLLARAREEGQAILAKAAGEAEQERSLRLGKARAMIERQEAVMRAAVGVEIARRRSARVEAVLQSIHDGALQRLLQREGMNLRAALTALTAEALRAMEGDRFEVELAPEDRKAVDDRWPEEVRRCADRSGVEIAVKEGDARGIPGPVIRDARGRQAWDNRFARRLERMWPALRRQIAAQASLLEPGAETEARG